MPKPVTLKARKIRAFHLRKKSPLGQAVRWAGGIFPPYRLKDNRKISQAQTLFVKHSLNGSLLTTRRLMVELAFLGSRLRESSDLVRKTGSLSDILLTTKEKDRRQKRSDDPLEVSVPALFPLLAQKRNYNEERIPSQRLPAEPRGESVVLPAIGPGSGGTTKN
ncbi:disease resistance protein [Striga asiatica]|uniref:Disease resistance protein n=1 Tax=Striga asiatica TaxID=4170 RepID=A0A5A7QV74_STRAF|nr:disease resistance protein [Striga asiatica]